MAVDPMRLTRFIDQPEYGIAARATTHHDPIPRLSTGYLKSLELKFATRKGVPFEKFDEDRPRGALLARTDRAPLHGTVPVGGSETKDAMASGKGPALARFKDDDWLESSLSRPAAARMAPARFRAGLVEQPEPVVVGPPATSSTAATPSGTAALSSTAAALGFVAEPEGRDGSVTRIGQQPARLMLPSERRRILEDEVALLRAESARKELAALKARRARVLRARYSEGVIGVLDPHDPSVAGIYGSSVEATAAAAARQALVEETRRARIERLTTSAGQRGWDVLSGEPVKPRFAAPAPGAGGGGGGGGGGGSARAASRDVSRDASRPSTSGSRAGSEDFLRGTARSGASSVLRATAAAAVAEGELGTSAATRRAVEDGGVKFMPVKSRVDPAHPALQDNIAYIMGNPAPLVLNERRIRGIVNNETNGRTYDPITGAELTGLLRPTIPEKKATHGVHPSIAQFSNILDR